MTNPDSDGINNFLFNLNNPVNSTKTKKLDHKLQALFADYVLDERIFFPDVMSQLNLKFKTALSSNIIFYTNTLSFDA